MVKPYEFAGDTVTEKLADMLGNLNICSKQGLSERFDSTIGAATVLMPFGGKYQLTRTRRWLQSCRFVMA